jgi:hypothetical protein
MFVAISAAGVFRSEVGSRRIKVFGMTFCQKPIQKSTNVATT